MTETEKAYIAGFLDGDGCISLAKNNPTHPLGSWMPVIYFINTNKPGLLRVKALLNLTGWIYKTEYPYSNRKTCYKLMYQANNARAIISLLLPFLFLKRRVAECVLGYPRRQSISLGYGKGSKSNMKVFKQQRKIVAEVRKLNKRGK